MPVFDYIFAGLGIGAVLIVLVFAVRTGRFFRTLLVSSLLGLSTLLILYALYPVTGFRIEPTPYSIGAATIFGLPGTVCMAIVNIIFGL